VRYLTPPDLVKINQVVVEESGGSSGVRERGLLESITLKPQATFGGEDLYPDIFLKAAALFEAIVNYHVFIDGNKRSGVAALAMFLHLNDFRLTASDAAIESFVLKVAQHNPDLADAAIWIREHAKPIKR
jgi:death on curing protein